MVIVRECRIMPLTSVEQLILGLLSSPLEPLQEFHYICRPQGELALALFLRAIPVSSLAMESD